MIKRKSKEKRADGEPATAESASAAEWRRFAEVARELAEMPAPSWARLRNASLLLTTGASAELKAAEENGGEPSGDFLTRPETLRAAEIMENDPQKIANAFLQGEASPVAESTDMKEFRADFWRIVSEYEGLFKACMQGKMSPLTPQDEMDCDLIQWHDEILRIVKVCDVPHFHFSAFSFCFSFLISNEILRLTLAEYLARNPHGRQWMKNNILEWCGAYRRTVRERLKQWDKTAAGWNRSAKENQKLQADIFADIEKRGGKFYADLPLFYENAYTAEHWTGADGKSNAPKYGGGGVCAGHFLSWFVEMLRTLQGKPNGILAEESARRSESATGAANPSGNAGADVCAAHDELLSAYARRIISNYRAGISFDFLTDTGRVHIADLTQKQWEAARQLLETPPDDENAGWVKMPDGWKIPQRCKGGQATFFDRVHSKAQESANGKGAGYYRIARDIAKRGRGGKRAGSGRPRKQ